MTEKNRYIQNGDNIQTFVEGNKPFDKLETGLYTVGRSMLGYYLNKMEEPVTDNRILVKDTVADKMVELIENFLSDKTKENFSKYGLVYKTAFLLHGPPGTGKTMLVHDLIEKVKAKDAVIFLNPNVNQLHNGIEIVRKVEPGKLIVVILEEVDCTIEYNDEELAMLMDGETQYENIIFIGTTNYLKDIPSRFKNRPGRFAHVVEMGYPNEAFRKIYFENKIFEEDRDENFINNLIEKTSNMSIDHLKHIVSLVCCYNVPVEEAIERVREMQNLDKK